MPSPLYRPQALRHASSPEGLDELMHITSSRAWLGLAACAAIIVFAAVWGFWGAISVSVAGNGMLVHPGGLHRVTAPQDGSLLAFFVRPGDRVRLGQPVAVLAGPSGSKTIIRSDWNGTVQEVAAGQGSYVRAGESLARIDEATRAIEAIIFVPIAQARALAPGMLAEIQPGGEFSNRYGFIYGRVRSVSQYAPSPQRLHFLIDNDQLETALTGHSAVQEVHVDFDVAPTASGLHWSVSHGPPGPLRAGGLCSAKIVVRRQRPIDLLYPQG